MRRIVLALCATLASCSTTPREAERAAAAEGRLAAAVDAELAGLAPGRRSACLPVAGRTDVRSTNYGSAIVYRVSRDLKYRNDTNGPCGRPDDILVTQTPLARVCSGDIVQTVDRASRFPTGSCALGEFVEYRRP